MKTLTLGNFEQGIIGALADDLTMRVTGFDPREFNFSHKRLKRLVRKYGKEVIDGLNKELPKWFRAAIANLVRSLSA
jgi:hypothetical protein